MRQSKQAPRQEAAESEKAGEEAEQQEEAKGEEEKKEEAKEEAAAEEEAEEARPAAEAAEQVQYGDRLLREQCIQYDFAFLCDDVKKIVPEPQWPDPDNEPLPPPLINSIQKKPPTRAERAKITKFSIWTPLPEDQIPKAEEGEEAAPEQ